MSSIIRRPPSITDFWPLYHALRNSPQWRGVINYYIQVPGILFYDFHGFAGNAPVNLIYMYGVDVYSYNGVGMIDHHLVDDDLLIFWRDIMREGLVTNPSRYSWRVRNNPLFMQLPNPLD